MARQISIQKWPLGLEHDLLFVRVSSKVLSRRGRVRLRQSRDGLDEFSGAIIQLDLNRFAGIVEYKNSPFHGTKVLVTDFGKRTIFQIIQIFGIKRSDIIWVNPEAEAALDSVFRASRGHVPVRTAIQKRSIQLAQNKLLNAHPARLKLAA